MDLEAAMDPRPTDHNDDLIRRYEAGERSPAS